MKKDEMFVTSDRQLKEWLCYLIVIIAAVFITFIVLELWYKDLYVPFYYGDDAVGISRLTANFIDGGNPYYYPNWGAPYSGGVDAAVPDFSLLYTLALWFGTLFSSSYGLIMNLLSLATFPLVAIATYFALRQFRVSQIIAMVFAMLYTFLPIHFFRFQRHLPLSNYFLLPIVCLLVYWIISGVICEQQIEKGISLSQKLRTFCTRKILLGCIAFLLLGLSDIYNAFFACIVIVFAGIYGWIANKKFRCMLSAISFIVAAGIGIAICLLVWLLGTNAGGSEIGELAGSRSIAVFDVFALRISDMLFPFVGHRIPAFNDLALEYFNSHSISIDTQYMYLGLIGIGGFFCSVFAFLFGRRKGVWKTVGCFGSMTIFILLIATVGGLNFPIGMFLTTVIRCYGRMSVWIAFLALATVALLLNEAAKYLAKKEKGKKYLILFMAGVVLLGAFGIYDQSPGKFPSDFWQISLQGEGVDYEDQVHPLKENYEHTKAQFYSDKDYVKRIEEMLPDDAMVFVLPALENIVEYNDKMAAYEIWRPFYHSTTLQWSMVSDLGTYSDEWQYEVGNQKAEKMLQDISIAGFSGISLNRNGYEDSKNLEELEGELKMLIGSPLIESSDGVYAFYDIREYAAQLEGKYTQQEWQALKDEIVPEIIMQYGKGVYKESLTKIKGLPEAPDETVEYYWCQSSFNIRLTNFGEDERKVRIEFALQSHLAGPYNISVSVDGRTEYMEINSGDFESYSTEITLPPGETKITISSDAETINDGGIYSQAAIRMTPVEMTVVD